MSLAPTPVFGLVMIGGAHVGAAVRDLRIANELAERGCKVHIFWVIDDTPILPLHPSIRRHTLLSAMRYSDPVKRSFSAKPSLLGDVMGRCVAPWLPLKWRLNTYQRGLMGFDIVTWAMTGLIGFVCRGVGNDPRLLKKWARVIGQEQITHLLPTLSILGSFCEHVLPLCKSPPKYLVTFQGYELYGQYAEDIGCLPQMLNILATTARNSNFPAVVVSSDYQRRVEEEIGLRLDETVVVPACIDLPPVASREVAIGSLKHLWPTFDPATPLITFMGRQDTEKGIDLLLYAAKILTQQGVRLQLATCGTTAWGQTYRETCRSIARNLRLPLFEAGYVSDELRTQLFRASHCVVYPSIHREPFGMVPVEAMAQETPVVVSDTGGVAEVPFADGQQAGLTFQSWDTADLATQLRRLIEDRELHQSCAANARHIAERYSVANVTDRLLHLMNLSPFSVSEFPQDIPEVD